MPTTDSPPQLRIWGPLGHTFVHSLAFLLVSALFVVGIPRFEEVLRDYDVALPGPTQLTLDVSGLFVANWFVAVPLLLLVDGAILFGLSQLPGRAAGLATVYSLLVMLTAIAALTFVSMSLLLPLIVLIQKLS